jgi:hypothetical protein
VSALLNRSVFSLFIASGVFLGAPAPAAAQSSDKPAEAAAAVKSSPLRGKSQQPGKEPADKSGPDKNAGAKGGASPMDAMKSTAAPKPGAMPLGTNPTSTGKIGTESAAKGKLGTPPDPNNKDRPPRPN